MEKLSIQNIITSAQDFCNQESDIYRTELFGVTDGKAVGTYIEHLFRDYLSGKYDMTVGSSANGFKCRDRLASTRIYPNGDVARR